MRTTRRPRWPIGPHLSAYMGAGMPALECLAALPMLGRRIDAVLRARGAWLNDQFLRGASDEDFVEQVAEFYDQVVPAPFFGASLRRHAGRIRRGVEHLAQSTEEISVRMNRCLNRRAVFAVPGAGPAFWSAIAQSLDPLRFPAWTPEIVKGARRLGLIRRRKPWYGDLVSACEELRRRDPRLTATHVDHFLTLVGRMTQADLHSGGPLDDPLPALISSERGQCPLRRKLMDRRSMVTAARTALLVALRAEDAELAIAALESIDCRIGLPARAWDAGTLLQWIAWIWHDDDPLAEASACECHSDVASRSMLAAVLHLRSPERHPQWTQAAAAGLARLADAPAINYSMYVEGVAALCQRYWLHTFEAPGILARFAPAKTAV